MWNPQGLPCVALDEILAICDIPESPALCLCLDELKGSGFRRQGIGWDIDNIWYQRYPRIPCPLPMPLWVVRLRGSKAGYRVRYWQSSISPNPLLSAYPLMNCKVQGFEGKASGEILTIIFDVCDIPDPPAFCAALVNGKVQGFKGRISGDILAIGDIPESPALCLCLDEL